MKPVPFRDHDWYAYYDGDEPDDDGYMRNGTGATEAEAIQCLLEDYPDHAYH